MSKRPLRRLPVVLAATWLWAACDGQLDITATDLDSDDATPASDTGDATSSPDTSPATDTGSPDTGDAMSSPDTEPITDTGLADADDPPCHVPEPMGAADAAALRMAWDERRVAYRDYLVRELQAERTYALYNVQLATVNLLMHAEHHRDRQLLAELASLYLVAFPFLREQTDAVFYYAPDAAGTVRREQTLPLTRPAYMWTNAASDGGTVGPESTLVVAQFVYNVARLARVAAEMGDSAPAALSDLTSWAWDVLVEDHYLRWGQTTPTGAGHFQVSGWGCNDGSFGHVDHLRNRIDRSYGATSDRSYCNAVLDTDLWIVAGIAELLMAHQEDPAHFPLSDDIAEALEGHVAAGVTLFGSRVSRAELSDRAGGTVPTAHFDLGAWDDHADYRYAADTAASFPGWSDPDTQEPAPAPRPGTGVGLDISHARRFVAAWDSLYRYGRGEPGSFPDETTLRGFANQFTYGVWDGAIEAPQFTNFMDGSNGWYRVNYASRPDFGYGPYGLADAAFTGGYGLWSYLAPELRVAIEASYRGHAFDPTNPDDTWSILTGLPSLAAYDPDADLCPWP